MSEMLDSREFLVAPRNTAGNFYPHRRHSWG